MRYIYRILMIVLITNLSGCLTNPDEIKRKEDINRLMIQCPAQRAIVCPYDNKPVCGVFASSSTFDYSSKCLACARRGVVGYIPGRWGSSEIVNKNE